MKLKLNLNNINLPFMRSKDAIGVDIGNYSVKIVHLKNFANKWSLQSYASEMIYLGQDTPGTGTGSADKRQMAVNAIKKLLSQNKIMVKYAATSVSGNSVIVRYVKFPKMPYQQLAKTIPVEAEAYIPFAIQDVNIAFQILGDVVEDGATNMETLIVATKKEVIQNKIDILVEAGLVPVVVDVDSFAVENAIAVNVPENEKAAAIIVNSGVSTTNISVIEGGKSRVVRDVFIAGDTFTKSIQRNMQINWKQAEEYKIKFGIGESAANELEPPKGDTEQIKAQVHSALTSALKELIVEIQRSIDYYQTQGQVDKRIEKIYLCGGGMMIKNVDTYLQAQMRLPVELFNPFKKLSAETAGMKLSQYAVAVGLATRYKKDTEGLTR